MILRVDPRLPLVWRSPASAQFGIDPPAVVLPDVTAAQEKILSALVAGISRSGLAMLARSHPEECDDLLDALSRVLITTPPQSPSAHVAVLGAGSLTESIARVLAASGVSVSVAEHADELANPDPDLAIVVGHYVIAPSVHSHWLRRDVPHLPVVVSDSAAEIGPVVTPGITGCLLCVELHRRDADPAWPAIATQLMGRTSHAETPVLIAEAAAEASRMALHRLGRVGYTVFDQTPADATSSVRIDHATGRRDESLRFRHPECGCQQMGNVATVASGRAHRPKSDWGHDAHPDLFVH
ncbi:TOMM precursor leader peptide-binding protein [Rhodoglobus aureus]|uniref:Cyclodehydratase n=1 Tax=Rhodoglobus aureus TaxID=191497 RepID=A0ABN1VVP7_9MICO